MYSKFPPSTIMFPAAGTIPVGMQGLIVTINGIGRVIVGYDAKVAVSTIL